LPKTFDAYKEFKSGIISLFEMYRNMGAYFVHFVTTCHLDGNWTAFVTCNKSRKYWPSEKVCGSLVPPPRNTCCQVLRATERWTALYHFTCEDVDDYWSLRSHRRRQERGPRSQKVGCGLGDYRGSRATSAGRRTSSVLRGLTGDSAYCFGSIEAYTVTVISTELVT